MESLSLEAMRLAGPQPVALWPPLGGSEGICVDDDDWEFVLAAVDAIRPTYEALLPPKPDTRREPTP